MATSFCSERTAEYVLVPELSSILSQWFDDVVPIFSYANREFTKLSQSIHMQDEFRVLALLPRRPKVEDGGNNVYLTFNYDLKKFVQVSEENNIPVLFGCPIASSFWELGKHNRCLWLSPSTLDSCQYFTSVNSLSSKMISQHELKKLIIASPIISFNELVLIAKEGRDVLPKTHFGIRYRPIYFLLR